MLGAKLTPLVTPPVQVYVTALPVPVKVTVEPEHKDAVLATAPTVGKGCNDTEVAAVLLPQALVPVTVYPEETLGTKATPFVTVELPPTQT